MERFQEEHAGARTTPYAQTSRYAPEINSRRFLDLPLGRPSGWGLESLLALAPLVGTQRSIEQHLGRG